jgi:hypothetical protein
MPNDPSCQYLADAVQLDAKRATAPVASVWIWLAPTGCYPGLTKNVLEAGLEAQMLERLDYDRRHPSGWGKGNSIRGLG